MESWIIKNPERLEFELRKLDEAGYRYSKEDDGVKSGILRIKLEYRDWENKKKPSQVHNLNIHFPPNYPDFPFQILAPSFPPGDHINPESGLCLLQDVGNKWDSRDYLAAFLYRQVRDILRAHRGDTSVLEAQEGVRQTGYLPYLPGSAILVGGWEIPRCHNQGHFRWRRFPTDPPNRITRGVVTHIEGPDRALLGEISMGQYWSELLKKSPELRGRWVRLPTIPKDYTDPLKEACKVWPELETMIERLDLVGILIPEKKDKNGEKIDNWVFVLRFLNKVQQIVKIPQIPQDTGYSIGHLE